MTLFISDGKKFSLLLNFNIYLHRSSAETDSHLKPLYFVRYTETPTIR